MTSVRILWLLIALFWVIAEIRLIRKTRVDTKDVIDAENKSQGWLWFSVTLSVGLAMLFKRLDYWPIPIDYLLRQFLALLICISGLGLRYWAVITLGNFFSTHVLIQNQHQMITGGPYRWIRHPAYSGLLIALAGTGLAMGDFLASLLVTVLPFIAFRSRIEIEEKKLINQFEQQYLIYLQKTYKLVPFFY